MSESQVTVRHGFGIATSFDDLYRQICKACIVAISYRGILLIPYSWSGGGASLTLSKKSLNAVVQRYCGEDILWCGVMSRGTAASVYGAVHELSDSYAYVDWHLSHWVSNSVKLNFTLRNVTECHIVTIKFFDISGMLRLSCFYRSQSGMIDICYNLTPRLLDSLGGRVIVSRNLGQNTDIISLVNMVYYGGSVVKFRMQYHDLMFDIGRNDFGKLQSIEKVTYDLNVRSAIMYKVKVRGKDMLLTTKEMRDEAVMLKARVQVFRK